MSEIFLDESKMNKVSKEKQAAVPQKLLHELFDYNELTGSWVNRTNRGRARKGQPVGYLNKKGYIVIGINGVNYYAHRLTWTYVYGDYPNGEQPFIDHINGNPSDNRIENLKVSSAGENSRNQKMYSNNTSDVTGVCRIGKKRPSGKIYFYWVANWYNENRKQYYKHFSVHKLGEEQAKQSAINYRVEQIHLLEVKFGISYSARHGTEGNLNE